MADWVIAPTARRHGITDRRIKEALENVVVTIDFPKLTMHLGYDVDGIALELGVRGRRVVHAMRLRRSWRPLYRRHLG